MTPGESTREYYRLQGKLAEQARIIKLLTRMAHPDEASVFLSMKTLITLLPASKEKSK